VGLFDRKEPEELPYGYQRAENLPYNAQRSLTASACKLNLKNPGEVAAAQQRRATSKWQSDVYEFKRNIPVISYSSELIKAALSRVRYYPAVVKNPNEVPTSVYDEKAEVPPEVLEACKRAVARLSNTPGGLSGLGAQIGISLWIAGEGTLVEFPATPKNNMTATWKFLSVNQLVYKGKKVSYKPSRASKDLEPLPTNTFAARIWTADEEFDQDAVSSLQCVQDSCDELLGYARLRRTVTWSRLNAGMILVPDGLNSSEMDSQDQTPELEDIDGDFDPSSVLSNLPAAEDGFEEELIESMTAPIRDDASSASIVPLVVRGNKEDLKEVRYVTFDRAIDEQLNASSDRALASIKQGLAIPEDMTASMTGVKYSNSVRVSDDFYRHNLEPLALSVSDGLTTAYFRQILRAYGVAEEWIQKLVFWFDASEILTKSDRTAAANDGHDRNLVSDTTWRAVNGFSEDDAPTGEEQIQKAVLARAMISDALLSAVIDKIAPDFNAAIKSAAQAGNPPLSERASKLLGYNTGPPEAPEAPPAPEPPPAPEAPPIKKFNPSPLEDGIPSREKPVEPPTPSA
jgi:hypothetical protein